MMQPSEQKQYFDEHGYVLVRGLFTPDERVELLKQTTAGIKNARVTQFHGLLVEFAKQQGACAILRGLRAVSDFEFEFQMALMNRRLEPQIETVFMMPSEHYSYLSSSIVKEIAALGGSIEGLVPDSVEKRLKERFKKQ